MKIRTLLILTAVVSSILGAIVVYLILSVPNDLRADALLKDARTDLAEKNNDEARQKLTSIVQNYPRTDAAAAATVALITLADSERQKLERDLAALAMANRQNASKMAGLEKGMVEIKNAPPKVVTVTAPAPKKTTITKKPTPKKKTTTTRRRRR